MAYGQRVGDGDCTLEGVLLLSAQMPTPGKVPVCAEGARRQSPKGGA